MTYPNTMRSDSVMRWAPARAAVAGTGRCAVTGLRDALTDYLQLRRRLGFEMPQDGRLLEGFVTFLERAGAERISTDLALDWARLPGQAHPSYWGQRLSVVRGFARHLATTRRRACSCSTK